MTNRLAAIPMTLSDLQCHSPTFQMIVSYGYAAVDKISTHVARRAVHLR